MSNMFYKCCIDDYDLANNAKIVIRTISVKSFLMYMRRCALKYLHDIEETKYLFNSQ